MSRLLRIAKSSVGRKLLMAATGLALLGFVVIHLLGNLKMFFGPEEMNSYAETLHSHPGLIWPARLGLLAFFAGHIGVGLALWARSRAARPLGYRRHTTLRASLAARLMPWSGLLLFSFIGFHLLHFTFRVVQNERSLSYDSAGRHDVYDMVLAAFQRPLLAGGYVLAMAALGLHLWHGAQSLPQTLGLHHSAYNGLVRGTARVLVVLLVLGFCSLPLSIYFGLMPSSG